MVVLHLFRLAFVPLRAQVAREKEAAAKAEEALKQAAEAVVAWRVEQKKKVLKVWKEFDSQTNLYNYEQQEEKSWSSWTSQWASGRCRESNENFLGNYYPYYYYCYPDYS